jgi:uncharacterized membrane protein
VHPHRSDNMETNMSHHEHDTDYVTFAATYSTLGDAEADYDAVKSLYYDADMMDTFDAAVITRGEDGKVKIVKKHEEPTRHGGWAGAGIGLAVGAIVALFPGAAVGLALAAGAAGGAVIGAVAGHVSEGFDRDDLKELGELLDEGQSGLVVVAATDESARVEDRFSHAAKVMHKDLRADKDQLRADVEDAAQLEGARTN